VESVAAGETDDARTAIQREKRMKEWRWAWKLALIEKVNPQWRDLYDEIAR
jgi:putative endonuclease